ncbi:MFS transporter [Tropicimonas sp. IMCC34043]|uniref:MFS transporter n=1 Tax=Tropicimonas sp. IMCC34043 TaxID=2248760 RepID=UPI000E23D3E2|nr:MFS transporter [Tropicimonas sp. IMCC34043]
MTDAPVLPPAGTAGPRQLGPVEFVAMMAMLFATVAISIDAMLPALPQIAAEISPDAPNRAQLVVTSFVLGMGFGTMFTGPLSDTLGRKPVAIGGTILFIFGALLAAQANTLETMVLARGLQGLGAASPRIVAVAIIRDLHSGRAMARLMSFIMMAFTLIPALAPSLGAAVIYVADWRAIFMVFIAFAAVSGLWLQLRQPETLDPARRRPFRVSLLVEGTREIVTNGVVLRSMIAQSLCFAMLFANLSSTQQVFDVSFGRADSFPLWFGGVALLAGSAGLVNALLVERVGMRKLILIVLSGEVVLFAVCLALMLSGLLPPAGEFAVYVIWTAAVFGQMALTVGNLNALAMEPMGHLAGLTASVVGSLATVVAVVLAVPIGLAFDGTPVPLMAAVLVLAVLALVVVLPLRRS